MDPVEDSEILNDNNTETNMELDAGKNDRTESATQKKHLRLPLARIKHIMKSDPDCGLISHESVFLVAKVTEMFIELLAIEAGKNVGKNKRKTVLKRDVEVAIENIPSMCFLDGALE
ncbi:unnamed protein product [Phyllotreta striolata]|uniref:Transcription factor CBF/NF-Y/archaeal histone domain-containing protein n=1 Tax=Phyllotreta striolata TaxID=444603 RepID=A0A9N9TWK6_PHYSR|nr:unnamed protein product [Phyllotreta striolata]